MQVIGDQQQITKISHHDAIYDPTRKYIIGKKPCARDAHSANIYQ